MKPLAIVAAVASNRGIGYRGKLPWNIPEDLKHFKSVTMGHAIIMGRKTWDDIGRPLAGRRNIVVSTRPNLALPGVEVFETLEQAIDAARRTDGEPCVIGGASIYGLALAIATKMYITEVHRDVEADTYFPEFDKSAWRETTRRVAETQGVEFVTWERTYESEAAASR